MPPIPFAIYTKLLELCERADINMLRIIKTDNRTAFLIDDKYTPYINEQRNTEYLFKQDNIFLYIYRFLY
jgi:hypothetical protein